MSHKNYNISKADAFLKKISRKFTETEKWY